MGKVLGSTCEIVRPFVIIDSMSDDDLREAEAIVLGRLQDAVAELIALSRTSRTASQVLALLRGIETQRNRITVAEHALIAEAQAQGLAHEHACPNTANWLSLVLRISPAEAVSRVRAAADLGPRRGLTGEALPPVFAHVADAQATGSISAAHARVITRCVDELPFAVQAVHDLSVQHTLVEHAQTLNPKQLAVCARRISDCLDPHGTLTTERDRQRRRDLAICPRRDGSARIEGELTPLCAEALRTVLDTLARPRSAVDDTKDPRTPGQRNHDGLHDGLLMMLRSGLLPDCGGIAATIVLTMTPEQFQNPGGLVTTGHGALISAELALSLLGNSRITPVALGKSGAIIAYGSFRRFFTEGQRLAMIARDGGCSFPGCDQPPARCQSHHVTDHAITRRTSVGDGTLLCGFHHREHAQPRLALPHDQRHPTLDPAPLDRPAPNTSAQSSTRPNVCLITRRSGRAPSINRERHQSAGVAVTPQPT
ncbi:MAG: hypothetical protein DLM67_14350 [Candidatus Nephthysia bennettiae]|nr:MAG: hypothetical protein DLM67_14350 [Candidatus Dormibacteraeota bacterium]